MIDFRPQFHCSIVIFYNLTHNLLAIKIGAPLILSRQNQKFKNLIIPNIEIFVKN